MKLDNFKTDNTFSIHNSQVRYEGKILYLMIDEEAGLPSL